MNLAATKILTPQRRLWLPGDPPPFTPSPRRVTESRERAAQRFLRRSGALRDWMRSPFHAMGRLFTANGWAFDTNGGSFGSTSGQPCCVFQARKCSDNSLAGIYVKKSQFPSFPSTYPFKYGGICYYAQASDTAPCNSTPLVTGETATTGCSDSACSSSCPGLTSPSTLAVSGVENWDTTCTNTCPFDCNNGTLCSGSCDAWDDTLHWVGADHWKQGTPPGGFGWVVTGVHCHCSQGFFADLSCSAGVWTLVCGTPNGLTWTKTGGGPTGTYVWQASSSTTCGGIIVTTAPNVTIS